MSMGHRELSVRLETQLCGEKKVTGVEAVIVMATSLYFYVIYSTIVSMSATGHKQLGFNMSGNIKFVMHVSGHRDIDWSMVKCLVSSKTRNKLNAVHPKRNSFFLKQRIVGLSPVLRVCTLLSVCCYWYNGPMSHLIEDKTIKSFVDGIMIRG